MSDNTDASISSSGENDDQELDRIIQTLNPGNWSDEEFKNHLTVRQAKAALTALIDKRVAEKTSNAIEAVKQAVFTGAPFASKDAEYQARAIFELIYSQLQAQLETEEK